MNTAKDILIIDDDRDLVSSLRIILESQGYQVRAAHTGRDGYGLIEDRPPDMLILDVMMSTDTEGFDLAWKMSRHPVFARIPILMVTGFPKKMSELGPDNFQHILGENWPVTKFLEKPVEPAKLLAAVAEILG